MTLTQFFQTHRVPNAIVMPRAAGALKLDGLPPLESLEPGKPVLLGLVAAKARREGSR